MKFKFEPLLTEKFSVDLFYIETIFQCIILSLKLFLRIKSIIDVSKAGMGGCHGTMLRSRSLHVVPGERTGTGSRGSGTETFGTSGTVSFRPMIIPA